MFTFALTHLALALQLTSIGYVALRTVRDKGAGW
jgi:hypothetical protein